MKPTLKIRQQIAIGLLAILILALACIYAVVEFKVKPDLTLERQRQIAVNQEALSNLLSAKLEKIQVLTSTLALLSARLPKDEALFKTLFPSVIDNHDDASIAGGGIWPEPNAFTKGVDRRSFFWARSDSGMKYLDDYNDPSGPGYHNDSWYTVGRNAPVNRCSWSDAYIDPVTKTPMVTCTVPIKEKGQFTGVATIDMMLADITKSLEAYGTENQGYVFAIDPSGQVISFPKGKANLVKNDGSMLTVAELSKQYPSLKPALTYYNQSGRQKGFEEQKDAILGGAAYVNVVKLPSTGWSVGLVVEKSRMTEIAQNMGWFLMLAIGALLIVVGVIAATFFRSLLGQINQTTTRIHQLAEGGSTQELEVGKLNELGELRQAVNGYGDKLKQLLGQIHQESANLVKDAGRLSEFSHDFLNKANSLSDENHTLAAATEELAATSHDVSMYANETKETVERIHNDVRVSGKEMGEVINTMRSLTQAMTLAQQNILKLDEDSRQANSMLSVIRDIAEQTNLLALNAAIEAARAGETGRGFAVVADEVRNLAAKSESSAVEIEQVLGRLQVGSKESVSSMELGQQETEKAVQTAELTANHLQEVVNAFSQITEQATQISEAAHEQQKVSQDLTQFVSRLQELTGSNAADSNKLSNMSKEIDAIAKRLNALR
ncbi:Methyl-accepting chemotaxis protein PctC [Marinomonas spartinae]|uniref:Methyl-accepting chemotaxis protein PctC n=1 Tax=Marinomonas spartinae TaxID=1792290 RepID=A0A1A8T411_9GAMM|nr:methyl-accepting chemotaxis protein [Marinomonas spartinae]SBS26193.1 Methyl-accepting chemotaxis protein PctC [Marinomonas spartinae]SBS40020.1 Methyl-accepting chemotaxis protein PctC [Marinomonas spartinae]